ncbi:MAG: NADPH-dependent FMN reductase [Phycisphaerae bacterium]
MNAPARKPQILALSGSIRTGSYNTTLLREAVEIAESRRAEVRTLQPDELDLPFYNGDLEARAGLPDKAVAIKTRIAAADGLLIASPAYNGSISPLLKNALDWASRPIADEPRLACFAGKPAALVSASPGPGGGANGLAHARDVLTVLSARVLQASLSVPAAYEAFDEDNHLKSDELRRDLEYLVDQLLHEAAKPRTSS